MTRLTESQLRWNIDHALADALDGETTLQVDLFYGYATAAHRGVTVYAPDSVAVTTHAPGGFVARSGSFWTWSGPLGEATHPTFARRLIRRALAHAYDYVPAPNDEPYEVTP